MLASSKKLSRPDPWDLLSEEDKLKICNYGRNPNWWNHLTCTTKIRREERDNLKKIDIKNSEEFNDADLRLARKPMIYFW